MVNILKHNNTFTYFDKNNFLIQLPTLYARHLVNLSGIHYSPQSVTEFVKVTGYFLKWIEEANIYGELSIDEKLRLISRHDIESWIKHQMLHLKQTTVNHREFIIKDLFSWFTSNDAGRVVNDISSPYKSNKLISKGKNRSKAPKFITVEELIVLLNGFKNESERCIIHAMFDTGMRISEAIRIKRKHLPDINLFPEGLKYLPIYISGSKGRAGHEKERIGLISRPVLSRINRYHQSSGYRFNNDWYEEDPEKPVFLSVNGKEVSVAISKQLKRAAKRMGLPHEKFSPHKLRHGAALSILRSEMGKDYSDNLLLLKELLGHNHITTTEMYTSLPYMMLDRFSGNNKVADKYGEAEMIFKETFLPPRKNKERRGHR